MDCSKKTSTNYGYVCDYLTKLKMHTRSVSPKSKDFSLSHLELTKCLLLLYKFFTASLARLLLLVRIGILDLV